jgi:hypothetical protein
LPNRYFQDPRRLLIAMVAWRFVCATAVFAWKFKLDRLVTRSLGHCFFRVGTTFTISDHTIAADAASMHSNRSDTSAKAAETLPR